MLASLGCQVTLLERNPLVHALLEDGLLRARNSQDETFSAIIARMKLVSADANEWLNQLSTHQYPDVIYLDPMFPERQKSALVQKSMRFFHEIVGADSDSAELLAIARRRALKRITVKRPANAGHLAALNPDFMIKGKTTRYDVYLPLVQTPT